MCGIIGIIAQSDVNIPLYEGLSMLQHRGQDAAGLVVCHNNQVSNGYAVVGVVPDFGIFAFRDPNGIRPLCLGRRQNKNGRWENCVSSESVVFNIRYTQHDFSTTQRTRERLKTSYNLDSRIYPLDQQ